MRNYNLWFYFIFIITFLAMHGLGMLLFRFSYILNAFITSSVVLLTLLLLNKWCFGESFRVIITNIGLRKTRFKYLIPGIIISVLLLLMYPLLGYLLHAKILLADGWFLNFLGLFLTGGIMEESVFRGYLFGGLRRKKRFRKAVIESMICFSITHLLLFVYFDWTIALMSTFLAIGLSIPLAYLFEKAENTIWSAALVHTMIRTIGLVFTTTDEHYMSLTLAWMAASLLIPYLVLLFDTNFRQVWSEKSLQANDIPRNLVF